MEGKDTLQSIHHQCGFKEISNMQVLQGTAGDSEAPSDDKYSPSPVPVTSLGPSTAPQQGGSAITPAKEALAADNVKEDRGGDLTAAEGPKEQEETLREGAAAERRRAGSANAVVQRSPEQLSPVAPDKLTVDEETGFRNVTVSPPLEDTSGLEERSAASRAVEGVEAALEGLEPGRDQLGKVGSFKARHFVNLIILFISLINNFNK